LRLKHPEAVPKKETPARREERTSARNDPRNPFNPLHPFDPSVSVAGRGATGDIVQIAMKASYYPSRP
jgi:hypothetical protein